MPLSASLVGAVQRRVRLSPYWSAVPVILRPHRGTAVHARSALAGTSLPAMVGSGTTLARRPDPCPRSVYRRHPVVPLGLRGSRPVLLYSRFPVSGDGTCSKTSTLRAAVVGAPVALPFSVYSIAVVLWRSVMHPLSAGSRVDPSSTVRLISAGPVPCPRRRQAQ